MIDIYPFLLFVVVVVVIGGGALLIDSIYVFVIVSM